jgi:hypothetical protein
VYELTWHAAQRVREMQVGHDEVRATLVDPTHTYPGQQGRDGSDRVVLVRERLAVVMSASTTAVVTVLWAGAEGRNADGGPVSGAVA